MKAPLDILREIKSVTFASVENGKPYARIIDVMLVEDNKLYFLTGRGKSFYHQITATPEIAICGMTPEYLTVRVWGKIKPVERLWVDRIFEANPMMNDLYPGEKRDILDAFCLYEGEGEIFDLSITPPRREAFTLSAGKPTPAGFLITDACQACGICAEACPVGAIVEGDIYRIRPEICLHCGRCYEHCPCDAIINLSQPTA